MNEIKIEYEPDKLTPYEITVRLVELLKMWREKKDIGTFVVSLPRWEHAEIIQNWTTFHAEEANPT